MEGKAVFFFWWLNCPIYVRNWFKQDWCKASCPSIPSSQFLLLSVSSNDPRLCPVSSNGPTFKINQFSPRLTFLTPPGGIQTFIQTFWTQTCEKNTRIDHMFHTTNWQGWLFYNAFNLFKTPVCCTTQHYCGYKFSDSYIAPRQRPTNPECQAFMNFIDESNNLSKQFSQKYCWWKKSCTTWDI